MKFQSRFFFIQTLKILMIGYELLTRDCENDPFMLVQGKFVGNEISFLKIKDLC